MLFKSMLPDIELPTELMIWDWLFDSEYSSLCRGIPDRELGGYQNAITKERINWRNVKECTTWKVEEMTYALKVAKVEFLMIRRRLRGRGWRSWRNSRQKPTVFHGYLDNEKATRETFDGDGWLHTGDQGNMDEEGCITIVDRTKDMIKANGIGVAPSELEDPLLGYHRVEDVAVFGTHDNYSGESPKAYVVLKPCLVADDMIGNALIRFVQERNVRHKWIKEKEFVEEIPKSANRKILRKVIKGKAAVGKAKGMVVRYALAEKAML
ncbi:MAG: hypothetical protein Q9191_001331 [Dirinaria sp. TL-2023a]